MYLREMGGVELLSREGEIAIAKRIEAGKELMIGGLYENPIALNQFLQWRDNVDNGSMMLRDIIDLETTYARLNEENPDNKNLSNDSCLLYTSDAADDVHRVDLGGRRIIKKNIKIINLIINKIFYG